MGSPASEPERFGNQTQHRVTLSHGFWMLETEVTQAMWEGVMPSNPSQFKDSKKHPVENVAWVNCQAYIQKLNKLLAGTPGAPAGFKFSLPTEAQWEYACRAGTATPFHFGNDPDSSKANYDRKLRKTSEAGSYPANAWGLCDMHGNVCEWCLDWYDNYPRGSVTDPTGPASGSDRVFRGGSWYNFARFCRSAYRYGAVPPPRETSIGLRLSLVRE